MDSYEKSLQTLELPAVLALLAAQAVSETARTQAMALRPSGDRAVVVDYKFGSDRSGRHVRQVAEYMRLMAEMGYKRVEGYVWYISLGEIVDVAL